MANDHDIRLILTDMDGTILPYGQEQVSERTRAAFHAAIDAGIRIGPASGRGFSYIPRSFGGDAACSATCLATNGMQVYLDGQLVHQRLLPRAAVALIGELVHDLPHTGLLCFEDGEPLLVEGERQDLAVSFPSYARACRRVDAVPDHDIEKANVFIGAGMDETRKLLDYLLEHVKDVGLNPPLPGFLNITSLGWSKASGIDVLCSRLGIGLDQVVVFGDGGNDVEMLAHVPYSAVVADAAPEATEAARWRVGRCEDEAVVAAIEAIVAGEWPFEDDREL